MGWKNVKEHYRIGHTVCVEEKGICIGSPYIHDIIVIALDGKSIVKPYRDGGVNADLARYQAEMESDMGKLCELVNKPDTFDKSLPVFTYRRGEIIEDRCEAYGWPNPTHDGKMQYDNTYSADKLKVVKWAKEYAICYLPICRERIEEKRKELAEWEGRLAATKADLEKLERDFPVVVAY